MSALLQQRVRELEADLESVKRSESHMRDGLELILCLETAVPNGTTKKIMRVADSAVTGKPFDI